MSYVVIYTDGSCHGNPGPGGYGAVLLTKINGEEHRLEISDGYRNTTNNQMELLGPIRALERLSFPCDVLFVSDSQYFLKGFMKDTHWVENWKKRGWKNSGNAPVKNKELWMKLDELISLQKSVSFQWVKGHENTELNNRCDELANLAASDEKSLKDHIDL
jgi:ribonuclease HI